MKRCISVIILLVLLLGLCSCSSFSSVTYKGVSDIPEDGIITASVLKNIRDGGSVAVFSGKSGAYRYEWTFFSSDMEGELHDINLAAEFRSADGVMTIEADFASVEPFGFPAVLSVYLDTKWNTNEAVVYRLEADGTKTAVCTASVTGSGTSILNFSVTEQTGTFVIIGEGGESGLDTENDPEEHDSAVSSGSSVSEAETDPYLTNPEGGGDGKVYSDGSSTGQNEYKTDPVPEGKPLPSEPQDQTVNKEKSFQCTFSIECTSIFNNLSELDSAKLEVLPSDGIILKKQSVTVYEGESVWDVLSRVCREKGIHLEASQTPMYNSAYVEGIGNLYEFDCGPLSGWTYLVNGWSPNYGCSRYVLSEGDSVQWRYTCDLGKDVGAEGGGNSK
ncbi:MAG: DUF4430 domain-containing protein [Candidatus Avispirillum sp.]